MKQLNLTMLDGVPADATYTGTTVMNIDNLQNISLQCVVSGGTTPAGSCKVQVSNDIPLSDLTNPVFVPTNWFDLTNASVTFTDNAVKGTASIAISHMWARVVWTYTSGSGGTVTAVIHANGQQ